ncbi:uncharacterized protein LOC123864661 isoform X1 [Maniola jurtina]|uniref:uncharacterized protein LOC123864661 isoform X1 n=1 Tax=Maniola jurtina TaxID=191418 RepID=UPI001E6876C2|nr:uncharacterized protein LOC123864661 isoform X1 [Maniola jurtina]XP_045761232.1 uncharacterized protein LOC123864661 isoform X1 [Maniola jurtina]
MASNVKLYLMLLNIVFECNGVSWRRQLEHIAKTRLENDGVNPSPSRRFYQFDPRELSSIIGVPSSPSHLPEAEPVLPGHTLLRPALGMLKSAVKFPHRELEDGAGVYGNIDNLGLRYDSRNERLMYSGFRRFPSDYIMVIPSTSQVKNEKPRFKLESAVLNLDRQAVAKNEILKILKKLNIPALKGVNVFVAAKNGNNLGSLDKSSGKDFSYYLKENTPNQLVFNNVNEAILRANQELPMKNAIPENPSQTNAIDEMRTIPEDDDVHSEERMKKKDSWLHSLDTFDNIKIMQEAPEINDLVPTVDDTNIRKWWFYNSDDYEPFSRERL